MLHHPPGSVTQLQELASPLRRPRTAEDFLKFCDVVLAYTNYPHGFCNEDEDERKIESPLNSVGESAHVSAISDSSSQISSVCEAEAESDEDTWGMVTCWCGKPFAGRPMIECESCLVWLHLSCARVRKSNIPKHFKCSQCKPPKMRRKRPSSGTSDVEGGHHDGSHDASLRLVQDNNPRHDLGSAEDADYVFFGKERARKVISKSNGVDKHHANSANSNSPLLNGCPPASESSAAEAGAVVPSVDSRLKPGKRDRVRKANNNDDHHHHHQDNDDDSSVCCLSKHFDAPDKNHHHHHRQSSSSPHHYSNNNNNNNKTNGYKSMPVISSGARAYALNVANNGNNPKFRNGSQKSYKRSSMNNNINNSSCNNNRQQQQRPRGASSSRNHPRSSSSADKKNALLPSPRQSLTSSSPSSSSSSSSSSSPNPVFSK